VINLVNLEMRQQTESSSHEFTFERIVLLIFEFW